MKKVNFWTILVALIIIYIGAGVINSVITKIGNSFNRGNASYVYSDSVFSLITTPENKVLEFCDIFI